MVVVLNQVSPACLVAVTLECALSIKIDDNEPQCFMIIAYGGRGYLQDCSQTFVGVPYASAKHVAYDAPLAQASR